MDFTKNIFQNRQDSTDPFIVAHRGVCGANIPCNSMLSFQLAVESGADVVELDVSKSKDGEYFVFHPGMEKQFLESEKALCDMTAEEIRSLPLLNFDGIPTHYRVPTLKEALAFLKGKTYINVDKFWTDIAGITAEIRKAGVEKQVIVKTPVEEKYFAEVEKYAPDFMFMPLARHVDDVSEKLRGRNINFIGMEALFSSECDEIASADYVRSMHERGLLVWVNAIVYNEQDVVSAHLTDDVSLECGGDAGWGKLISRGYDFIQTDWLLSLQAYMRAKNAEVM